MSEGKQKWITQKEASELLGKSLQSIHELTNKGRWRVKVVYGKRIINLEDVLDYRPRKSGRPKKEITKQ